MGEEIRQALARLFRDDESFRSAILGATSVDDALRIAGEYGVAATADDLGRPQGAELSDVELELAAGGNVNQIWPTAPWVAC